jgi:CDP-diacylglycerol---serine O-phosphatidyltransferase
VKKIAVIPTLLTLGNAVCGFAAIALASKIGHGESTANVEWLFAMSGWLIIGAMGFDALDGYVARLSKTASEFGMQLDSLCDAISFGAAPAFLLLKLGPDWSNERLHQALAVIAALYMACTILRLARFNVESKIDPNAGKRFRGLPSPAAAGCLASLAIMRGSIADAHFKALAERWPALQTDMLSRGIEVAALVMALAAALLMVSRVPYPHLTKQILRGRKPFNHLVYVIVFAVILILIRELALVLIFGLYALSMPLLHMWVRTLRRAVSPPATAGLDRLLPQ